MRVAPEGLPFIAIAWGIELGLFGLGLSQLGVGFLIAAVIWLPIAVWVVAFFRDPARHGPRGDRLILSPADGKVVGIIRIDEPHVIGGASTRVSVFMSVMNVHVNRYPTAGTVTFRRYQAGKFFHAGTEKASAENEQSDTGVTSPRGPLLTRQIAGSIARRIVTDHSAGMVVKQGDRMGLIRFGSRVDLFVPAAAHILVKEGDVTRAGVTVIAEWT